MAQAQGGSASGQGQVIRKKDKQQVFAQGGTIHGTGKVYHKDGTVTDITLSSDPLTQDQAEQLNNPTQEG
jgi:hypothetical protein